MFDEIEEDEREIRRLQRGELFRRPKPKLPEQQGDVMERRESDKWYVDNGDSSYGYVWQSGALLATCAEPSRAEQIATEHNQHAALVEQRDLLVEAARSALDWLTESFDVDEQPSGIVEELRAALATVEQGEGRES